MNMFETATRIKMRFDTVKGKLSVEDLWDLSLSQLNDLAKTLKRELREAEEEDFLEERATSDVNLQNKFDVVLYILTTKKNEIERRAEIAEKNTKRQKLLEILDRKRSEATEQLSEEELLKQINELG